MKLLGADPSPLIGTPRETITVITQMIGLSVGASWFAAGGRTERSYKCARERQLRRHVGKVDRILPTASGFPHPHLPPLNPDHGSAAQRVLHPLANEERLESHFIKEPGKQQRGQKVEHRYHPPPA